MNKQISMLPWLHWFVSVSPWYSGSHRPSTSINCFTFTSRGWNLEGSFTTFSSTGSSHVRFSCSFLWFWVSSLGRIQRPEDGYWSIAHYSAIGLNRRRYTDVIATAPAILIAFAFKIFFARPLEKQFTYYEPSAQEAEEEFQRSLSEKRTNHHEMEKRFLHPALQSNMLFTVRVFFSDRVHRALTSFSN